MENALDIIARRLTAPKLFRVVVSHDDGTEYTHDTETLGQARNHASMFARKIGRKRIRRETGSIVRIKAVKITSL